MGRLLWLQQVPDILVIQDENNSDLVDDVVRSSGNGHLLLKKRRGYVSVPLTLVRIDGTRAVSEPFRPQGRRSIIHQEDEPFYGEVDILGTPTSQVTRPIWTHRRM